MCCASMFGGMSGVMFSGMTGGMFGGMFGGVFGGIFGGMFGSNILLTRYGGKLKYAMRPTRRENKVFLEALRIAVAHLSMVTSSSLSNATPENGGVTVVLK